MMSYTHVHACAHVLRAPSCHPSLRSTPTPQGDPQNQSKFNITCTNRDISIPFEDLKSVKNSPPMGGCMVWWVGGWLGGWMGGWLAGLDGWGQVKTLKILKMLNESR